MKLCITFNNFEFFFLNENFDLISHELNLLTMISTFFNFENILLAKSRSCEMYLDNVSRTNFAFEIKSMKCSIKSVILMFFNVIAKHFFQIYVNLLTLITRSFVFAFEFIVISLLSYHVSIIFIFSSLNSLSFDLLCVKKSFSFSSEYLELITVVE